MSDQAQGRFTAGRGGRGEHRMLRSSVAFASSCRIWMSGVVASLVAFVSMSPLALAQKGPPPGVVISSSSDPDRAYIGTPAIAILPDGRYVAAHDFFGKNDALTDRTRVFESRDR